MRETNAEKFTQKQGVRNAWKALYFIRNNLQSSRIRTKRLCCVYSLVLLICGFMFVVGVTSSSSDNDTDFWDDAAVDESSEIVDNKLIENKENSRGDIAELASKRLIQPYMFPNRTPNDMLPNGKSVTENKKHNDNRCETLNDNWVGREYILWVHGNSQHGQDRVVRDYFKGAKHGRYIEVGSYDGETFSNTWILDWCLQWEGLLIDPSTRNLDISGHYRPNAIHYHVAINHEEKEDCLFFENDDTALAGLQDTVKTSGQGKEQTVQCVRLERLLDERGWSYVDFVSIDTEGNELNVLKGIDFEKVVIQLFLIEANGHELAIERLLKPLGYTLIKSMSGDLFYSLGGVQVADIVSGTVKNNVIN